MSGWIDETFVLLCELISFNPEGTTAVISFLLMWMETGAEKLKALLGQSS